MMRDMGVTRPIQDRIRREARRFIAEAFEGLAKANVIPPPMYHPWVTVGRDYYGGDVGGGGALEALLEDAFPERFADPLTRPLGHAEFPSAYTFSLLEACVVRCARGSRRFRADSPEVDESITEMLMVLAEREWEIACCRFVTHLTTATGEPLEVAGIRVIPERREPPPVQHRLAVHIQEEIPGAFAAFNREDPRPYDPPHSLLIATKRAESDPYSACERASLSIDRFLRSVRLLTAGTAESAYEVRGPRTLVAGMRPYLVDFGKGSLDSTIRRTVWLDAGMTAAVEGVAVMIESATVERKEMAATSFDVALSRYQRSYGRAGPWDHLVDLATALEAILIAGDSGNEAITFRLRNRAAALLPTSDDPPRAIFDDVGTLYALRSLLVHGGQIKRSKLVNYIGRISTVADVDMFGVAVEQAIDRLRDLVRRAILARLCLASEPDPVWPFVGSIRVDEVMTDEAHRVAWRFRWHERMTAMGAEFGIGKPRPAVWTPTPEAGV